MSDTPTPKETPSSGLPDTPCSRSYLEVLDTGRKRRVFLDDERNTETMSEKTEQTLLEIARIQRLRRANWKSPDGPDDEELENRHAVEIRRLRAEIQTPDDPPTYNGEPCLLTPAQRDDFIRAANSVP